MDGQNLPDGARQLWLFRPGKTSAVEASALADAIFCPDFGVRQDLSDHIERDLILAEVEEAHPGENGKRIESITSQIDWLLNAVMPGDIALLPMPRRGTIWIGMVLPGYASSPEGWPGRRVEWLKTDVPKDIFLPDMIHSMGALQKVCKISRNDALARVEAVVRTGRDPGPDASGGPVGLPHDVAALERLMLERIAMRIGTAFAGHALADLVAAVLETDGYRAKVSPPGPDGGVDILAGRGITGLDGCRLTVQVKSGDIVSDHATLQQLIGAMSTNGSEAGLLVSWGGITRAVQARVPEMWFKVRIWTALDLTERVITNYADLPLEIRDRIGLKQIWVAS